MALSHRTKWMLGGALITPSAFVLTYLFSAAYFIFPALPLVLIPLFFFQAIFPVPLVDYGELPSALGFVTIEAYYVLLGYLAGMAAAKHWKMGKKFALLLFLVIVPVGLPLIAESEHAPAFVCKFMFARDDDSRVSCLGLGGLDTNPADCAQSADPDLCYSRAAENPVVVPDPGICARIQDSNRRAHCLSLTFIRLNYDGVTPDDCVTIGDAGGEAGSVNACIIGVAAAHRDAAYCTGFMPEYGGDPHERCLAEVERQRVYWQKYGQ